jgi:hypothetical protein
MIKKRKKNISEPRHLYVALFSNGKEVKAPSYTRVATERSTAEWGVVTVGKTRVTTGNVREIAFPLATSDWGVITEVMIMDAPVKGHALFEKKLRKPFFAGMCSQLYFAPGKLRLPA